MVADAKLGRFNTMIIVNFLSALFCLAVWIPVKNTAGVLTFIVIFGFSSGGFISLAASLVAQITTDLRTIGARFGVVMACQALGAVSHSS